MIKRCGIVFLCLLMCITTLPVCTSAASLQQTSIQSESLAQDLKSLRLFKGISDTDFALQRKPSRVEVLVMLVRVLGQEDAALSGLWKHPFTDVPSWADKYVGYAYENGLTKGVSDTHFGGDDIAPGYMYLTFMLRALGYSEGDGDFTWDDPYGLASSVGILPADFDNKDFFREDIVKVSYAALNALIKGSRQTLANKLIESNVFTREEFDSVYHLGAVSLDIEPLVELKKMVQQFGSYDEKNQIYTLVIESNTDSDYFDKYEAIDTVSYKEKEDTVTLRCDSYTYSESNSSGRTSKIEGESYYAIYLTSTKDAYGIEGYDFTNYIYPSSKTEVVSGAGEIYAHKWDRYNMNSWNWMKFEFTRKEKAVWGTFASSFALNINNLLQQLEETMSQKGLSNNLSSFGFDAEPYKYEYLNEYDYSSNLSKEEIQRLTELDMTVIDWYTTYAEGKERYDDKTFKQQFKDRGQFESFDEAHNYLYNAPNATLLYEFRALGLSVRPAAVKILLNLLMSEAKKNIDYKSENLEISFDTNEELVYHPDCTDYDFFTVRGKSNLTVKNYDLREWTEDDRKAIKNLYFYDVNSSYGYNIHELPRTLDVDVHMTLYPNVFGSNIMGIVILENT